MKKIALILTLISSVFIILSCTQEVEKHDVYVTVYPLQYLVEELFEDTSYTVDIVPGTTSHEISVEWAPKEIIAMKDAELMFYIGANYDLYIERKLSVFEDANVQLVDIETEDDYIEYIPGIIHDHEHEGVTTFDDTSLGLDPHFWISPKRMLDVLDLVHDYLVIHFPEIEDTLAENYLQVKTDLEDLHIEYDEAISSLTKPALTSTNLYGYLHEDYDFEFIPISPGYHEEPDNMLPAEAEHIMEEIALHQITKIIYEKTKTSPASDNIFEEMLLLDIDAEKLEFNILQALTDEERSIGKDYISEMMENLEVLKQAGLSNE